MNYQHNSFQNSNVGQSHNPYDQMSPINGNLKRENDQNYNHNQYYEQNSDNSGYLNDYNSPQNYINQQYYNQQIPNQWGINKPVDSYNQPSNVVQNNSERKQPNSNSFPHPISVYTKDFELHYGKVFDTSQYVSSPPSVCIPNVIFSGTINSSPKFIRSTLYSIPKSYEILRKSGLPMALVINPLANEEQYSHPFVNFEKDGPPRCRRCRTYVNPHFKFINGGKNFICNICDSVNEVPEYYFCNLDQMGIRLDKMDRPELLFGSYDLSTNASYCRNDTLPSSPLFLFLIDVSYSSITSGMLSTVCNTLISILSSDYFGQYSEGPGLRIGIIAYDSYIYVMCPRDNEPYQEVILDTTEPFISSANSFIVSPITSRDSLISTLKRIPTIFENNKTVEAALGPVIKASIDAVANLKTCAKLFIFHSNLPTAEAQGKLNLLNDRAQLGTDDDKRILSPQINYYTQLANKCLDVGVGIDLYLFPNGPVEVATLSPLCTITGGKIHMFKNFNYIKNGSYFTHALQKNIYSSIGIDAMAKLRCSTGLNVKSYIGNISSINESELMISTIDDQKTFVVEVCHDDKVQNCVYFQFAILYTTPNGKRIIRVHNLALKVVESISDVFKGVDQDALAQFYLKTALKSLLLSDIPSVRATLIDTLAKILTSYRVNCSNDTSSMQLVIPESVKLISLYVNSILNLDMVSGTTDITPDDKITSIYQTLDLSCQYTNILLYSRLFDITSLIEIPNNLNQCSCGLSAEYNIETGLLQLRSSYERLESSKIYLLTNLDGIYLWIGKDVAYNYLSLIIGNELPEKYIGTVVDNLPTIDSELSRKLSSLITQIRKKSDYYIRVRR